MNCRFTLVSAVVLVASLAVPQARGTEALQKELAVVAGQVQGRLRAEHQASIAVGEFVGPAQLDTNFGPGVADALAQALRARGVAVSRKSLLSLRGRYARVPSDRFAGQAMVRLTFELVGRNDEVKQTYQARFYDTATIALFLGVTTALAPDGDLRARNLQVVDAAEKPSVVIDGTRVRTADGSPFAVEILVSAGPDLPAAPRAPTVVEGQAIVDIRRGESYQVRLYNQAPFEAAAIVAIDGLSAFAFCEPKDARGAPLYSFYPVAAGTALDVVGWFRTLQRSDAFVVTSYGQGASAVFKNPPAGKTGVLTVAFAACAASREQLPADERAEGRSGQRNETGIGPARHTQFTQVARVMGVLRDVITIRYTH